MSRCRVDVGEEIERDRDGDFLVAARDVTSDVQQLLNGEMAPMSLDPAAAVQAAHIEMQQHQRQPWPHCDVRSIISIVVAGGVASHQRRVRDESDQTYLEHACGERKEGRGRDVCVWRRGGER